MSMLHVITNLVVEMLNGHRESPIVALIVVLKGSEAHAFRFKFPFQKAGRVLGEHFLPFATLARAMPTECSVLANLPTAGCPFRQVPTQRFRSALMRSDHQVGFILSKGNLNGWPGTNVRTAVILKKTPGLFLNISFNKTILLFLFLLLSRLYIPHSITLLFYKPG